MIKNKLVVIIPAFNEAEMVGMVISGIPAAIDGVECIEVMVIDDGSTDGTAEAARECGAAVISHSSNRGVGQTFQTGVQAALESCADIVVNIDGDGQFDPREIPQLIAPILQDQADFIAADRFSKFNGDLHYPANMSRVKFWGNQVMSRLINALTNLEFRDVSCGFRAYSRDALLQLNLTGVFTYTQESFLDLANKKLRIRSVPVTIQYFPERKSRVADNLFRYTFRTLNIILRAYRDFRPLRFFVLIGLFPLIAGLVGIAWTGIHYINTGAFTPYKAVGLTGIYLFTLGLLLFIVGFLADMFNRLRQTQEKVLYYTKRKYYEDRERDDQRRNGR